MPTCTGGISTGKAWAKRWAVTGAGDSGDAMKDLTQGSITRALVAMALPIAIGMLFQTLYLLVDLYFVARLGAAAMAGVSSAGTAGFVILALTPTLGVGTAALASPAGVRRAPADA